MYLVNRGLGHTPQWGLVCRTWMTSQNANRQYKAAQNRFVADSEVRKVRQCTLTYGPPCLFYVVINALSCPLGQSSLYCPASLLVIN